ncbi:inverse autotransporter beta domain-containing protein [Zophobihabitans entericus]|uniref:LysM domain-containing protein n=1 Tax=Zophobihabitans entericus TaxID=1635327 RepID=A0A6G9I8U7_9GAMM|nr:inverse autotransporter beta domain-containing protein [Zophobihabitans entericus]QIQ20641.1 hypothetical protein IPMB12_02435 [Zophobihabitans entericus]
MTKSLNLSIIASFIVVALSSSVAYAKPSVIPTTKAATTEEDAAEKVRLYINSQQRSLYQIALLSGISVTELRELNKGTYDNIDVVKAGESIVLPASSPLLPPEQTTLSANDKYDLPKLGSSETVTPTESDSDIIDKHIAQALTTIGQQDWENMSSDKMKDQLRNDTQQYAENYVRNQVNSQIIDPIRGAAQDFLGRFGTAQLGFNVSDEGRLNNVSVKLFSPWYDSENTLIFSQMSFQEYENDRRIGNFGIGQRWDVADKSWLLGYNVFLDHDFQRAHNRLGLGLEAWSDYMKLAINYYYPLSDWKVSRDFDNYLERAARGFDVRFQGYLPSYPHLGGSLMFEQYFGDEVALFGKDNLQKDPYAVTIGVDYTPVPLFTIRGEHKQGQDSQTDAKLDVTMNYRIGVPLKDQLDPDMVAAARSLRGSRYDLVDRNNFIVLEYKANKLSVDLASIGEQMEGTLFPVGVMVSNAKGNVQSLRWNGADLNQLLADGGDLCYNRGVAIVPGVTAAVACPAPNLWNAVTTTDYNNWSVAIPPYVNATGVRNPVAGTTSTAGRYTFSVTVSDSKNEATSNSVYLAIKTNRRIQLDNITPASGGTTLALAIPASGTHVATLEGTLVDATNTKFSDASFYSLFPGTTTAPTAADVAMMNAVWSANVVSDGSKITFVHDDGTNVCPTSAPKCLIVKSITTTTPTDSYKIDVATSVEFGAIDVKLDAAPCGGNSAGSNKQTVHFAGSGAAMAIELYRQDPSGLTLLGFDNTGSGIVGVPAGSLRVGNTYEIKAYYDAARTSLIPTPTVTWSLAGNNVAACPSPVTTTMPASAPFFEVATGTDETYTLKGRPTSLASVGTSINSVTVTPAACAGDQGFNLRVEVN